jgi:CIC family chloride channel protein
MPSFPAIDGVEMICFLTLGAICGLCAPVYLKLLSFAKTRFSSLGVPLPFRLASGGVIVGAISMWWPQVWGNGYEVVNSILHEPWTWEALLCLLILKVVATAATVGSGAVGGVFTPTIFVGAAAGCLFGMGVHALWPAATSPPYAYAMVGMAAFLSASTLAPAVAILMIFEMTLSYQIILPLMLSCVIAFFVARSRIHVPMYDVLYHRTCRELKKIKLSQTQIEELIQPATTVVTPDAGVSELLSMFQQHSVRYMYVVDGEGLLRGTVELKNVLRSIETEHWRSEKTAADYMQRDVQVIYKCMTAAQALGCFLKFHGERLPVVERESRPVLIGAVRKSSLLNLYWEIAGLH